VKRLPPIPSSAEGDAPRPTTTRSLRSGRFLERASARRVTFQFQWDTTTATSTGALTQVVSIGPLVQRAITRRPTPIKASGRTPADSHVKRTSLPVALAAVRCADTTSTFRSATSVTVARSLTLQLSQRSTHWTTSLRCAPIITGSLTRWGRTLWELCPPLLARQRLACRSARSPLPEAPTVSITRGIDSVTRTSQVPSPIGGVEPLLPALRQACVPSHSPGYRWGHLHSQSRCSR